MWPYYPMPLEVGGISDGNDDINNGSDDVGQAAL